MDCIKFFLKEDTYERKLIDGSEKPSTGRPNAISLKVMVSVSHKISWFSWKLLRQDADRVSNPIYTSAALPFLSLLAFEDSNFLIFLHLSPYPYMYFLQYSSHHIMSLFLLIFCHSHNHFLYLIPSLLLCITSFLLYFPTLQIIFEIFNKLVVSFLPRTILR